MQFRAAVRRSHAGDLRSRGRGVGSMRGLLSNTTKRAWRTAFACALASCGLARSDEPTPSAPLSPSAAPPDLSAVYRDAYMNPNAVCPPGGLEGAQDGA